MCKKKLILTIVSVLFYLCASAQVKHNDYFVGKWNVMVYGTPSGDKQMIIELKRVKGLLTGAIVGPTDDIKVFKKIEETPKVVKLHFKYFFFNVNLKLQKEDETHCIGFLQEKYKAKGQKIN